MTTTATRPPRPTYALTDASQVDLPGVQHAYAVLEASNGLNTRDRSLLLAVGVLAEIGLRDPNGYNGHTAAELADFLGIADLRPIHRALDMLVEGRVLVRTPGLRYRLPERILMLRPAGRAPLPQDCGGELPPPLSENAVTSVTRGQLRMSAADYGWSLVESGPANDLWTRGAQRVSVHWNGNGGVHKVWLDGQDITRGPRRARRVLEVLETAR